MFRMLPSIVVVEYAQKLNYHSLPSADWEEGTVLI